MKELTSKNAISIIFLFASLTACSWVDSTGNQSGTARSDTSIAVPVVEFESVAPPLIQEEPLALVEGTKNRTRIDGPGSSTQNWLWELREDSGDSMCQRVDGYDSQVAAKTLTEACTYDSSCEITIKEEKGIDASEFIISLPVLKAPIALNYRLSAEMNDGELIERTQTLCAISINERPVAEDDRYFAEPGEPLVITAIDPNSLLANDVDDMDVRNQPLKVDIRLVQKPSFASQFDLQSDGSFFYRSAADLQLDNNGKQTDTFVYSITDGLHKATATATIYIAAGKQGPQAIADLPDQLIKLSDTNDIRSYEFDVSGYFINTDNTPLTYTLDMSYLAAGLKVQITEQGLIEVIVAGVQNTETGSWPIDVIATDGIYSARSGFTLMIVDDGLALNIEN